MTETITTTSPEPASLAKQGEMPFALVYGEEYSKLPEDLYIPPDALEVFLEAFEGPLDLLLYLIRRQNINILDIPVAEITKQYIEYVELMKAMKLELAAEYLVIAAMLGEIKSRMLLPQRESEAEGEENDPRAELVRRLQEYERFKKAAEDIDALPREERDFFIASATKPEYKREHSPPDIDLKELLLAFNDVLKRADVNESHTISREQLSTQARMGEVLDMLKQKDFVPFIELFSVEEGRLGVVVSFMAILELVKNALVELVQHDVFSPIHVRAKVQDGVYANVIHEFDDDIESAESAIEEESPEASLLSDEALEEIEQIEELEKLENPESLNKKEESE